MKNTKPGTPSSVSVPRYALCTSFGSVAKSSKSCEIGVSRMRSTETSMNAPKPMPVTGFSVNSFQAAGQIARRPEPASVSWLPPKIETSRGTRSEV